MARMSSIRLLRTFLAVAAEGSFAAAAPRVALTQAAVGQQMRALERELRRPLFQRDGKAVTLSDAGRAVLPQVHQIVTLYEQLAAGAPAAEPMSGTVHLGAIVSALRPLIEATLALKAQHPALDLHVGAAKSADLVHKVAAGELDAAIVVRDARAPSGLAWTPLYEEPMVLLAPATLPAATPRALLQRHPFIRFDRSEHTGQLVERTLRKLRVQPAPFLELNALEGIVELVRSGLGVTLVPLLREARWAADARLRVVELPQAEARRVAMVRRRQAQQAEVLGAIARQMGARVGK
jgi:DNA-binding transcriptional LysR family regulator